MGDEYLKFKVAAVQAEPIFQNREATVEKACKLIEEAGGNGARLIAFSESFIPGYPYWVLFQRPRTAVKMTAELFKNSVVVPSRTTDQICKAAKEADAYVIIGINEKEQGTLGTIYNSLLFISRRGKVMGVHRKLMPTYAEKQPKDL